MRQTSIGIVKTSDRVGGRKVFADNFRNMLHKMGYKATIVNFDQVSVSELNRFDILHFSDVWQVSLYFWKLLLARHPAKVLTVHGWVVDEALFSMRTRAHARFREKLGVRALLIAWIFVVRPVLLNLLFDAVTCPSKITAVKNKLGKAIVIKNPVFPETLEKTKPIDIRSKKNEIVFVTYVSIGSSKIDFVPRLIRIVTKLNKKIGEPEIILLVFGKLLEIYDAKRVDRHVMLMGFSEKFLNILRTADLFLVGSPLQELGFAAIEAGILGIPVAKFTNSQNCVYEEIHDDLDGIVAFEEDVMIDRLRAYVSDLEFNKNRLGRSLRQYLLTTRSWWVIGRQWATLFNILLSKNDRLTWKKMPLGLHKKIGRARVCLAGRLA